MRPRARCSGRSGPKVGSVDPGFGTAYLARAVGEKRAREIWYLCRRYTAHEAAAMGLVNAVVADDQLDTEVDAWCGEIMGAQPDGHRHRQTLVQCRQRNYRGISAMGLQALTLFYGTEESREGVRAFREKRKPDFRKYAK